MRTFSIGRTTENNIILNDNFVSRKHATLFILDNGQAILKDLGSSNGTFVNGDRITERYLHSSDIVKCAAVMLDWKKYLTAYNKHPIDAGRPAENPQSSSYSKSEEANKHSENPKSVRGNNLNAEPIQNQSYANSQPQQEQAIPASGMQQNIVIVGKAKSVGTAVVLAFFFGPLGLLYASVAGGLVMFLLAVPIIIFTGGLGLLLINPICIIWAVIAANNANAALNRRAGGLINNNFQR